jgi:hypothetical protein
LLIADLLFLSEMPHPRRRTSYSHSVQHWGAASEYKYEPTSPSPSPSEFFSLVYLLLLLLLHRVLLLLLHRVLLLQHRTLWSSTYQPIVFSVV